MCSSLISVVDEKGSQNVQFSHFSVKEFLTRFENVSSHIREGMEDLFDPDKPPFAAWLQVHDMDTKPSDKSVLYHFLSFQKPNTASPLYYAALCGFRDLVEQLIIKHPQQVNTTGGYYVSPLAAALNGGHLKIAQLLYERGAEVDVQGPHNRTPLRGASCSGDLEIVHWLLSRGANLTVRDEQYGWTPLHAAAFFRHVEISRLLLQYKADNNAQDRYGRTPLHKASEEGHVNVTRLLLEHGADVNVRDNRRNTSLHLALYRGRLDVARLLVEHGTKIDAENDEGRTAFQVASERGHHDFAELLSDRGSK